MAKKKSDNADDYVAPKGVLVGGKCSACGKQVEEDADG